MTIELVTGVPGAGKTLYTMSEKLQKLVGTELEYKGLKVKRRLMIGNVRDLLLPHEPIEVPEWSPSPSADKKSPPENQADPYGEIQREPGQPAIDGAPHNAMAWWTWCQPGDVIVVDECQNLFRPRAAGNKIPQFIAKLERHRHYGVDFVLITQHPQLLHTNVRNLIGRHEHLRRIYGGGGCILYEWDHCTHPDRVKNASSRLFRHKKSAFGLYKSAEVHTKLKHRMPVAAYAAIFSVVALAATLYFLKGRMHERFGDAVPSAEAAAAPARSASSATLAARAASAVRGVVADLKTPEAAMAPVFVGFIHLGRRCEAIADDGRSVEVELKLCVDNAQRSGMAVPYAVRAQSGASAPSGRKASAPAVQAASAPAEPLPGLLKEAPRVAETLRPTSPEDLALATFVHRGF